MNASAAHRARNISPDGWIRTPRLSRFSCSLLHSLSWDCVHTFTVSCDVHSTVVTVCALGRPRSAWPSPPGTPASLLLSDAATQQLMILCSICRARIRCPLPARCAPADSCRIRGMSVHISTLRVEFPHPSTLPLLTAGLLLTAVGLPSPAACTYASSDFLLAPRFCR